MAADGGRVWMSLTPPKRILFIYGEEESSRGVALTRESKVGSGADLETAFTQNNILGIKLLPACWSRKVFKGRTQRQQ